MKFFPVLSLICFSTLIASSCSRPEFKETKIAVAPSASSAQVAADAPSQELPPGHPSINNQQAKANAMPAQKIENIQKAAGGVTVEECFKNKKTLNNKTVSLRGKVIKFNSGILKRNWLHIQDGTGAKGQNDLVVTTSDVAQMNDTVLIKGTVHYDKDIGSGYFFPAIIEDAKITVEK